MSANLDTILVAAAILGALGYFAARYFRGKKSCNSGCGCDVAKRPPTQKPR
ncbi:MAG: hypothetical protein ABMA13_09645 [Chthoniobacteraceae bacterium]